MRISQGAENCLREMVAGVSKNAPTKGRRVTIYRGKHKGESGVVFWHGRDKFKRDYSANMAQSAMTAAFGTHGYRIGVECDNGDRFFCSAEYTIRPCNDCGVIDETFCKCGNGGTNDGN